MANQDYRLPPEAFYDITSYRGNTEPVINTAHMIVEETSTTTGMVWLVSVEEVIIDAANRSRKAVGQFGTRPSIYRHSPFRVTHKTGPSILNGRSC